MKIKHYFKTYWQIIKYNLAYYFAYRTNILRFFYGPAYQLALYLSLQTVLAKTPSLGGWTKDQVITLYLVSSVFYLLIFVVFLDGGVRRFLQHSVKDGELDQMLTKPMNLQFLSLFMHPNFDNLLMLIFFLAWLIWQVAVVVQSQITILSLIAFFAILLITTPICYYVLSTYAAVSLFVTKADEAVELFNKVTDYSQYPTNVFPLAFQVLAYSIFPIAFLGYVQTRFLLNQGSWPLLLVTLVVLFISRLIYKLVWQVGLKRYSSVSS